MQGEPQNCSSWGWGLVGSRGKQPPGTCPGSRPAKPRPSGGVGGATVTNHPAQVGVPLRWGCRSRAAVRLVRLRASRCSGGRPRQRREGWEAAEDDL